MPYRAVIFDLFGTLVPVIRRADYECNLAEMAAQVKAEPGEFIRLWNGETAGRRITGELESPVGNTVHILKTLGLPCDPAAVERAARLRRDFYRSTMTPRADAVPTLRRLKEDGLKTGLISDCSHEAPALWPRTQFAALIDAPVFSCLSGYRKPAPELYALACARLGVSAGDCLYVGDGDGQELSGALQAGMSAVRIRVPGEDDAFRRSDEEWTGRTIAGLTEVMEVIQEGNSIAKPRTSHFTVRFPPC